MSNIARIGEQVLYGLSQSYQMGIPYYIKDNFEYILDEEDFIISDEDIINQVRKILSSDYQLMEIPVKREYHSEDDDNFWYGDTELRLLKNKIPNE